MLQNMLIIVKIDSSKTLKSNETKGLLAPKSMDFFKDFQRPTCNVFKEIRIFMLLNTAMTAIILCTFRRATVHHLIDTCSSSIMKTAP